MNRKEAKALVTDWMAGEISPSELQKLKVYLEEHPTFRAEVNKYRKAWEDLDDLEKEGYGVPYMGPALERKLQEASSNPGGAGHDQASPETTCQCQTVSGQKVEALTSGGGAVWTFQDQLADQRMIAVAIASSVALFTCIYLLLVSHFQAPGWTARVTESSSGTRLIRDDRKLKVHEGMKIQSGDTLKVPGKASATLTYRNENTSVTVANDAKLRLRAEENTKYISLDRGVMEVDLAEQKRRDKLIVSTNDARAKAVGTSFKIGHNRSTHLQVAEGRVLLSSLNSNDTKQIRKQEYAKVTENGDVVSGKVFSGWVEDFDDVPIDSSMDKGETAWQVKNRKGNEDKRFSVSGGALRVHEVKNDGDLESGGLWTSEEIDISGAEKVDVSVTFGGGGCENTVSGGGGSADIDVELRVAVDGQEPKKVVGLSGDPQTPGIGVNGLDGSTLKLQIAATNGGGAECFTLDRVSVLPEK